MKAHFSAQLSFKLDMKTKLSLYNKGRTVQLQAGLPSIFATYLKNLLTLLLHYLIKPEEEDFINNSTPSETEVTSQHIPNPLTSDSGSLPMNIKRILRSFDFESMPLFRSHEKYFAALEDLKNMWKKLESCRNETKLTTIHNKIDHTTSSTSDDNRKTVISSILERFPSLLEENSKIEENFQKLSTEPSSNNALQKRSHFRAVWGCVLHSGNFPKRMRFDENVKCSCDNNN